MGQLEFEKLKRRAVTDAMIVYFVSTCAVMLSLVLVNSVVRLPAWSVVCGAAACVAAGCATYAWKVGSSLR